jgi:predicted DNA-binding protein
MIMDLGEARMLRQKLKTISGAKVRRLGLVPTIPGILYLLPHFRSTKECGIKTQGIASRGVRRVLEVRQRLKALSRWQGLATKPAASVCKAIRIIMEQLPRDKQFKARKTFAWTLSTSWKGKQKDITLTMSEENGKWNIDENQIEAITSLCLLSHETRLEMLGKESDGKQSDVIEEVIEDWLQPDQHVRILGSHSDASQKVFK